MFSPVKKNKTKLHSITFANTTEPDEKSLSQNSSKYKEGLSQPTPDLSHRQKLLWLQKQRTPGLWVQCDDCDRWRYLPNVLDSCELPENWYCNMNPDTTMANCSIPEVPLRVCDEEDLIYNEYSVGSVVWAHMPGWPWWPAMIDDCPDTEQFYWLDGFSDIPTHYNVVFFDTYDVTRGWIAPEQLKPYTVYKNIFINSLKFRKFKSRLEVAVTQANDAMTLSLPNRLRKYSFITRYRGTIYSPKKIKKNDLQKYQSQIHKKYNIEFPIESSSESEENVMFQKELVENKSIINETSKKLITNGVLKKK